MTEQYLPQGNSTQFGGQEPALGGSAPAGAPYRQAISREQYVPSGAMQAESDYSWAGAGQAYAAGVQNAGAQSSGVPHSAVSNTAASNLASHNSALPNVAGQTGVGEAAASSTPFGSANSGAVPPITRSSYFSSQQRSGQSVSPQSQASGQPAGIPVAQQGQTRSAQNAGAPANSPFTGGIGSGSKQANLTHPFSPVAESIGGSMGGSPSFQQGAGAGVGAGIGAGAQARQPIQSQLGTAGQTGIAGQVPLIPQTSVVSQEAAVSRSSVASQGVATVQGAPSTQPAAQQSSAQQPLGSTQVLQPVAAAETPAPTRRGRGLVEADQSAGGRVGMSNSLRAGDIIIDELLKEMVEQDASDMHLTDRSMPMIRKSGALKPLEGYGSMNAESLRRSLFMMLTQKQREVYEDKLELDFAYQVPGGSRFRVNLYQQRDSVGAAFRQIPSEIKALEDLGVPPVVSTFANLPRGLVLVTGPTGSGKSTTLASIVDLANRTRADHIMTVEDPIEFLHDHKKSIVNQREVGTDTWSFASALKHVLRQDPDIILVGEMRDLETISVALTAAETGHLVYATLHTQDAAQTIDRVIDVFPPEQQEQIRVQLAAAIQGVVCQTLCKRSDSAGRVVATEVLVATPAIRNLIREGKTHQIYSMMQAGAQEGMHTMDQHLADLTKAGSISYETGLDKCHSVADYNRLSGRRAGVAGMAIASAGMGGNLKNEGNL